MNQKPSTSAEIKQLLSGLSSSYFLLWIVSTFTSLLSDPTSTMVGVGVVLLGFLTHSALLAFTVFFLLYAVLRTINSIANAIGFGLQGVGMSLRPVSPPPPMRNMDPVQAVPPEAHPRGERINIVAPPASAPGSAFPGD